jgi:hypothetical protein
MKQIMYRLFFGMLFFGIAQKMIAQCPTIDLGNLTQNSATAANTLKMLGVSQEQLTKITEFAKTANLNKIISDSQLSLVKQYHQALAKPSPMLAGDQYKDVVKYYNKVVSYTSLAVTSGFLNTMQSKLGAEATKYSTAMGMFIAAARVHAEGIRKRYEDVMKANNSSNQGQLNNGTSLVMNDAERLAVMKECEHEMSLVLASIKLYYARVRKIMVSKKGVSSGAFSWFKNALT